MQQLTDAHKFPARKFPALQITDMHARSSTGCSTTPHTITRPEPPSLYDGTSPLHSRQHNNTLVHSFQLVFRVQSHDARRRVNSNANRKTAMKFTNLKTRSASHTKRTHTNCSTIPQSTFEITSRQVPVPSPAGSSQFLTAIPLPFSTLTLWSPDQCRCLLRALAPKPVEVRVAGGPRSDRHAVRVSTCAVHSPYARPAVCRSRHLAV